MKLVYVSLTALSLLSSSCKKETNKNNTAHPQTSCVCLKENIGVRFANYVPCHGFLTTTNYAHPTSDTAFPNVSTYAFFSSIADLHESGNAIITVDSVYLNQQSVKSIKDVNGDHMYYQLLTGSWSSPQEWRVFGANGIPTFTVIDDVKSPVADFSLLPNLISKSLVSSFKINGVENMTGGFVSIFSSESSGNNVSVILKEGSNEICFPQEQLNLVVSGKATLLIMIENTRTKTFGTKNIAISKKLQFEKKLTLNP